MNMDITFIDDYDNDITFITGLDDAINPEHYKADGLEAIDVMEAFCTPEEFRGHLRCTAIKYLLRLYKKNTPLENAQKCAWYVERLIKKLEENES